MCSKKEEMMKILENLADAGFISSWNNPRNETVIEGYDSGVSFTPIISDNFDSIEYAKKIKDKFIELGFVVELNNSFIAPIIYYKDEEVIFDRCFKL